MNLPHTLNQEILETGHVLFLSGPKSSQKPTELACKDLTWWGEGGGVVSVPLCLEQ